MGMIRTSSHRELAPIQGEISVRDLDIRCSARLPDEAVDHARCQLAAGHEGEHAVMFCSGGARRVRSWDHRVAGSAADHAVLDTQRPWLRGFPVPAWMDGTTGTQGPVVVAVGSGTDGEPDEPDELDAADAGGLDVGGAGVDAGAVEVFTRLDDGAGLDGETDALDDAAAGDDDGATAEELVGVTTVARR